MRKPESQNRQTGRGRPRGPELESFPARLPPKHLRDLRLLHEIMEGRPPINGLIIEAVERYIERKLKNRELRRKYESLVSRDLQLLSSKPRVASSGGGP